MQTDPYIVEEFSTAVWLARKFIALSQDENSKPITVPDKFMWGMLMDRAVASHPHMEYMSPLGKHHRCNLEELSKWASF